MYFGLYDLHSLAKLEWRAILLLCLLGAAGDNSWQAPDRGPRAAVVPLGQLAEDVATLVHFAGLI
jgi:hypothetical protein